MEAKMGRKALVFFVIMGLASLAVIHVHGEHSLFFPPSDAHYRERMRKIQAHRAALFQETSLPPPISPSPSYAPQLPAATRPNVYRVTSYGADPTGRNDSTGALLRAISDAAQGPNSGSLMEGIRNLGGARIDLEGGNYVIRQPLRLPTTGVGNLMIHGGTLRASDDFPTDGYLIDLSASPTTTKESSTVAQELSSSSYNYDFVTLKDLMLDSNYRGGGIAVINSLRTSIDNCFITHFTNNGILVQGGHETYIRNSFLGQHITAGGDPGERNFTGTAISLNGNDNAVTDVVIFSAAIGIMITSQANMITGVHCYNKATGFGGIGIYVKVPGLTQTRIVNSYLDYTGIVAEDPVQLHITNNFFLGGSYVVLKSVNGIAKGLNIVDNMFAGDDKGVAIVQLDESGGSFKDIEQVVVERNNVRGMNIKATVARGSVNGKGVSWNIDFSQVLLFPNLIRHVQYSLSTNSSQFPNHVLRNVSDNRVEIRTDVDVPADVFVTVDQGGAS